MKLTTNLGLKKPDYTDVVDIEDINDNMDVIDNEIAAHKEDGASHSKTASLVIGTSTAGWTSADCDYLCDGVEDNVEISAAIESLTNGGSIKILSGEYSMEDVVLVSNPNISIQGSGSSTVLKKKNDVRNARIIRVYHPDWEDLGHFSISDLTLDGNKTAMTQTGQDNILISAESSYVNNVWSKNSLGAGISGSQGSNGVVSNCTIDSNKIGIYEMRTVQNNIITNCDNGVYTAATGDVSFNRFSGNDVGITGFPMLASSTIIGNTIYNSNIGIKFLSLMQLNGNVIANNVITRGVQGLPGSFSSEQHTIQITSNSNFQYNVIVNNSCLGKAPTIVGGSNNMIYGNKSRTGESVDDMQIGNYTERLQETTGAIDLNLANVFADTPSTNRTYSITNAKAGVAHSFTLTINMPATVRTLTFPASVKWQGGEIPDLTTASKTYVLTFVTVNGGTTWLGMFGGEF